MPTFDERLTRLMEEASDVRALNDGNGADNPEFIRWRKRAQTAIDDKLGAKSRLTQDFAALTFFHYDLVLYGGMPAVRASQHQSAFSSALNDAMGILEAALEAEPRQLAPGRVPSTPLVHINQVGNNATATSNAAANVQVDVTVDQLRHEIAVARGLSPSERAEAMGAVPDNPAELTLENANRLLSVATKAKTLFKPVLGWLIANADHLPWV